MTRVEERFKQLSPLLDDAVLFIAQSNLSSYESAALTSLATARISMGAVLAILRSTNRDVDLSCEELKRIGELLIKNAEEADDIVRAAAYFFISGGQVQ
jgi:hypothetical protein